MPEPGETLRTLIHDLRSPLAVVEGFATMLARDEGALGEEQRRDFAARIAENATEMRRLLDEAAP
jgi:K+-sensing histidine kinase KdpD